MSQLLPSLERLLLTVWVGSQWAIGYIAAPTLFATLDSRQLAGELAGRMFHTVYWLGLVAGLVLLALLWRHGSPRQWRLWTLAGMIVLTAVGLFVIQPMMADLKAQGLAPGSDAARTFGMLHGVSSLLYLAVSLAGAALVALGLRGR